MACQPLGVKTTCIGPEQEEEADSLIFSETLIVPVTIVMCGDDYEEEEEDGKAFLNMNPKERSESPDKRAMKQMVRACQDPSWDGEGAAHSLNVAASPHKHSGGRVEPPASHTRESPPLRDKGRSASCHKPSPPETQLPPIKEEASLPDAEVSGYGLGTPTRGGQDFACKECPYTTNNSYNLNCHARTHNGERPYECSDCVCCFRTRSALNRHKRSQTCQRPRGGAAPKPLPRVKAEPQVVQCSDCKYSTSNAYNMKLHQRIHTDERPYACSKCDAAFRTQSHLYRHERCHRRSRDRAESLP